MTREHSILLHSRPGVTYILRWDDAFQALVAIGDAANAGKINDAEARDMAEFVDLAREAEVAK